MISPARNRSPNAASTSATWRTMSTHSPGIGLRIGGARELVAAAQDAAGQAVGCAAGARRARPAEHHMALIDVLGQDRSGSCGWRVQVDQLDRGRDAGNRGLGGVAVGAGWNIAADMNCNLRLGHRLRPAGERDATAGLNARILRQESHQRSADAEELQHRRRAEADLPAQRRSPPSRRCAADRAAPACRARRAASSQNFMVSPAASSRCDHRLRAR